MDLMRASVHHHSIHARCTFTWWDNVLKFLRQTHESHCERRNRRILTLTRDFLEPVRTARRIRDGTVENLAPECRFRRESPVDFYSSLACRRDSHSVWHGTCCDSAGNRSALRCSRSPSADNEVLADKPFDRHLKVDVDRDNEASEDSVEGGSHSVRSRASRWETTRRVNADDC